MFIEFNFTQEHLKELLRYQKSTGHFFWRERSVKWFKGSKSRTPEHTMKVWNSRYAGKRADLLNKSRGERRIQIQGKCYQASRVAYMYVMGEAHEEIGHKNKKIADNRFCNLIPSSVLDNRRNRIQRKGKSGLCGVSYHRDTKTWQVKIKSKSLGYFKTLFDACCARRSAELNNGYGGHFSKDKI